LRHPGGIFNIALDYVINDFLELLVELEEYQDKYGEYNDYKDMTLGIKLKNLINDLFKFRDSLYEVIQACCKKHNPPSEKEFIRQWLKKNKYYAGEELHGKIKPDLEYFDQINNKLKHTSSTIATIYFHDTNSAIIGFYVTGVADNGSIGPDEAIHPKIDGAYSASSYNFILKKLYYTLYKISYSFRDVIIKHFNEVYTIDLQFSSDYNPGDKRERELFYRMRNLPNSYFPDEVGKLTYEFKLEDDKFYLIEKLAESNDLSGYRIQCCMVPDGFARKFTLPYKK
jgi:hypothetical protein